MNGTFYFLRKTKSFQIKFMALLFFTYIKLLLVIFLWIEPSAFAQPHSGGEVGNTQNNTVTFTLTEEDHKHNSDLIDIKLQLPKEIQLNGNEVDLSGITQQLKRAEDSLYDTFFHLRGIKHDLLNYPIKTLCNKAIDPEECFNKASNELERTVDTINQNKDRRILYPSDYRPMSERGVNDRELTKALNSLDSECADTCSNGYIYDTLTTGSQAQYRMLYDKIKNKSEQCQKDLLADTARRLGKKPFPEACLKAENKTHPVCKNMVEDVQIIQARISELMELAYGPEPSGSTEANAPCLNCALNTEETDINPLEKLVESLDNQSQCSELEPGETKTVYSDTSLNYSYPLKKDSEGNYVIVFPMRLYADKDYDGSVSKEEAPNYYMNEVQKCLADANQKMLGPNGEKLKIQIEAPSNESNNNSNQTPRCRENLTYTRYIAIGSKDHRSNVEKYESDIDCPTIVHEVLHLTGLCDEYTEMQYGFYTDPDTQEVMGSNFGKFGDTDLETISSHDFKPAYDCRVTTEDSIMSDQYERWKKVENSRNKSLLTSAQFQKILYGSCPEKNKTFNECSRLAYQSSQTAKVNCMEAKQQCERENGMGHNKQDQIEVLQSRIEAMENWRDDFFKTREALQNKGQWNETRRDWFDRSIEYIEEELKSERDSLSLVQSPMEKEKKEDVIESLIERRDIFINMKNVQEAQGTLDKTFGEEYEEQLNNIVERIQATEERLEIVQAWPDSSL